ncbi:MAG TPA: nitroreductase family protein [Spirochaetota bacterium]|nr:nitroreductase family protein [Spirochaetota bacterium]HPI87910.1 nitroreductase family protein [Spirochaetota bacterium]HPR47358.1 nitroreductase family protein [Spirochaetota bacterium]
MELQQAIAGRRSVRKYSEYYVTDDEIRQVLDAARLAPSWANTQVWEFIVVRDTDIIEKVTGTYSEKNPAIKGSLTASVLIAACAKRGVSGCYSGKNVTKFNEWFMFDVGLAVQNLCLKAHELGLGSVVVGLMDHDSCKKILGLPDEFEVVASIPLGRPLRPSGEGPGRKELKDFVHLDRYGERFAKIY